MPIDLLIRGGTLVTPDGTIQADLAIDQGTIVALGDPSDAARDEIDATGLHIFPGVVDPHVHFNEPGRTEWEGFATGSAALAVGGGTTFIDMPLNSTPPVLTVEAFDVKAAAGQARSGCDFALWGGLTPTNLDQLEALADRGVIGFKAFMCDSGIDDFLRADDDTLLKGMERAASLGLPIAVHAENQELAVGMTRRVRGELATQGPSAMTTWTASRPPLCEIDAVNRALLFARHTGCKLHLVHLSTAYAVELVETFRPDVDVTCETCPHYLTLTLSDTLRIGPNAKCAPPIRTDANRDALQELARQGGFDFIASDHSPSPSGLKASRDIFDVWGGIAGVQSTLSAVLSLDPPLPLTQVARLTATHAARRFGLAGKGVIAPGFDADLALVDLHRTFTLTRDMLLDRHRLSPYIGRTFTGLPIRTLLRGHTIALDGEAVGHPLGRLITPSA
ncbi:MAG: allantoinase AllB [Planctomycetota bacterium]